MTLPERTCVVLGCGRAVHRSSAGGWVYDRCIAHVHALQTGAFGPDTPLSGPGHQPMGVPAIQGTGALAGGSPDGDLAGSRRAIAQATPGRVHSLEGWAPGELVEAFGR